MDMTIEGIVTAYYELVKAGIRTIQQVPTHLRTRVQEKLDADNKGA